VRFLALFSLKCWRSAFGRKRNVFNARSSPYRITKLPSANVSVYGEFGLSITFTTTSSPPPCHDGSTVHFVIHWSRLYPQCRAIRGDFLLVEDLGAAFRCDTRGKPGRSRCCARTEQFHGCPWSGCQSRFRAGVSATKTLEDTQRIAKTRQTQCDKSGEGRSGRTGPNVAKFFSQTCWRTLLNADPRWKTGDVV